jgi:hypothetical protein
MSRVITFSRTFPAHHPKAGQPTHFVEKILASLDDSGLQWTSALDVNKVLDSEYYFNINSGDGKHHTIRAGKRWKVGDKFSPRVWGNDINPKSGKSGPYHSKQIVIAPDVEIVKVWDIGLRVRGDFKEFYCNDEDITGTSIELIAKNDGLSTEDMLSWFNKPFTGQIICWNPKINY